MYRYMIKTLLVLLLLARYIKCQRRIVNGEDINKGFVVYIIWDLSNKKQIELYDTTTICGGFLISENLVITADECLKIFPSQYVIAGYSIYAPGGVGRDKKEEECLEIAKKPIIERIYFRSSPTQFRTGWQYEEVAIARVDARYEFSNPVFTEKCSYHPIVANFHYRKLTTGTDVIVYGWGSNHYHRPENISLDINQHHLMATTTKVINLEECNKQYEHAVVNKVNVRFCTDGESSLDVYGHPSDTRRANTNNTQSAPLDAFDVSGVAGNKTIVINKNLSRSTRRHGPCQNDHGGPISTWENGTEIVIGIITGYLVNRDMECVGPYIFTRLQHFSTFIDKTLKEFKQ